MKNSKSTNLLNLVNQQEIQGNATDQWTSYALQLSGVNFVKVIWSEIGMDAEGWSGFYGSSFRYTYVVVKEHGNSLLEEFEIKTHKEYISTWFNQGQGPALYSTGSILLNSVWNSIQDFDVIPDFLIMKDNPFSNLYVYHGTSSLKLQGGNLTLFNIELQGNNIKLKIIYKGSVLLIKPEPLGLSREFKNGWAIDDYLYTGTINGIEIQSEPGSYLGGFHIYESFPTFDLKVISQIINWNSVSLESQYLIVDIQIGLEELPSHIRHLNVYQNQQFVFRAYSNYFSIPNINSFGQSFILRIDAENLIGDIASSFKIEVPYSEIQASKPF